MVNVDHIKQKLEEYFLISADEPWSANQGIQVDDTTGEVNITGSVMLRDGLTQLYSPLPVKFGHVTGNFNCALHPQMHLMNLQNFPHTVDGDFRVVAPNLTSLEGAPRHVGGVCVLSSESLKSLEHLPESYGRLRLAYTPHLPLLRLIDKAPVGWSFVKRYGGTERGIRAVHIIEHYQGKGKAGALKAAGELIRAGYKENARW